MEWSSNLKDNRYPVNDEYYVDVVHDFNMHSFDCWLHSRKDDRCIYMTTVRDNTSQAGIRRVLKSRIPELMKKMNDSTGAASRQSA